MNRQTAPSADIRARRNSAIRAAGFNPRRVTVSAHIVTKGDRSDVWQVTRSDRFGTHIVASVAVSY